MTSAPTPNPYRAGDDRPGTAHGVPPEETPPAESSTGTGAGPYRPLTKGWGKGPLIIICVVALLVALFFLAYAITLNL
ncbi:DUF6480 family protein [Streptomyces sp. NPDC047014]|uniref:DUF6480 family protein n=1 Tax=Streptomyces sp. NPDC047014 TaxID=3155736 RepID=UPI0033E25366